MVGQKTVLVVDPYRHSRQGLGAALNGVGYRVETAASLSEAFALIERTRFDVAVIDLDLPPWSAPPGGGWELVALCRELHADAGIVAVTSEGAAEIDRQSQQLRVVILEKPISPLRLRGIVQTLERGGSGA